jgi:hypothetical protein
MRHTAHLSIIFRLFLIYGILQLSILWTPKLKMHYTTKSGEVYDLEKDFSSAERHVLQKLLLWKDMAATVEEFRAKKRAALLKGWGDSGPVTESPALSRLTKDFEEQVRQRALRPTEKRD